MRRHQRTEFGGTQRRQPRQQRRVDGRNRAAFQPDALVIDRREPEIASRIRVQPAPARFIQHQPAALTVHGLGHRLGHEHVHAPGVLVTPGQDQRNHREQHGECLREEQAPGQAERDGTDRTRHLRPPPAGSRRPGSRGSPRPPRPAEAPCAAWKCAHRAHWTGSHRQSRIPPLPAHCG
ncbi:hypothetical protein G6F62_013083 [Rhizopus arrhizus]|nr:hypothetical protein G6F62_013083 [Rhizopus arrhizus]